MPLRNPNITAHTNGASFHRPEKEKFKCTRCPKEYVFQTGLRKHTRDKHRYDQDSYASDEAGNKDDANYLTSDDNEEEDDETEDDGDM